ncbi:MAG: lytic transglycosylase domain-containing protein [Desulfuromonadales bacterium]
MIIALLLLPTLAGAFCFEEAGRLYGVSPRLLQGIARVESGMNPAAINRNRNGSVDMGLMQVNSFWLKTLAASAQDLIDKPCYNVMVGAWILSDCLDRHGKTWKAIGCYNAADHDKRVNYSWKVYRELLKDTTSARNVPDESGAVHLKTSRTLPHQRDAQDDTVPVVSTIQVTVTEKE